MMLQCYIRFKGLLMEPAAMLYAEHHDNIEAIYKKLTERRDTADVTTLLKELHRIVNEAIRAQAPVVAADPAAEGKFYDLSSIDLEKLREEFAKSRISRWWPAMFTVISGVPARSGRVTDTHKTGPRKKKALTRAGLVILELQMIPDWHVVNDVEITSEELKLLRARIFGFLNKGAWLGCLCKPAHVRI